jgi:hypothetical protein
MTQQTMAQEKAVELFKKYYCLSNNSKSKLKVIEYETAKQCALITVDEVIANIEPSVSMDVISARIKYWEQVKEEINKL